MKYVYTGLFIDNESQEGLHEIVRNQRSKHGVEGLSVLVQNSHITLLYKPETKEAKSLLFGTIMSIRITGYANDGENEGFSVEIISGEDMSDEQKRILGIIPKKKILHLTYALSPDAKAKNTENLHFVSIDENERITIRGVYGAFTSEGYVTTEPYTSESIFISPFTVESRKLLDLQGDAWEKTPVELRYPTNAVQEVFREDSGVCKHWVAKKNSFPILHIPISRMSRSESGNDDRVRDPISFFIRKVELYSFTTGISFLVVRIEYGGDESLDHMVDLSGHLSNNLAKEKKESHWVYVNGITGDNLDIREAVISLVENSTMNGADRLLWFNSSTNEKCNSFHRIVLEHKEDGFKDNLCRLAKGTGTSSPGRDKWMNYYAADKDRRWAVDTNGVASLTLLTDGKTTNDNRYFLSNTYQDNLIQNYFPVYLLALHEREAFLDFNHLAVSNWNDLGKLRKLRKKLLLFSTWSASNTISTESNYQRFYRELHKELSLKSLEQDVAQVVAQVDEYEERRADKRMNGLLAGIGVLTLFSVLVDGTDFIEKLQGQGTENVDMWDIGHLLFYGIIVGIIVFVILIGYMRRK